MSWTEERVDTLKKLWASGLSASQIARQMGGVTRNAVIGKVHRLGLAARAPRRVNRVVPVKGAQPVSPVMDEAPRSVPPVTPVAPSPALVSSSGEMDETQGNEAFDGEQEQRTVLTLTDRVCKWPVGNPGDAGFHFCGLKAARPGLSYCDYHLRIAYQPVERRRGSRRLK